MDAEGSRESTVFTVPRRSAAGEELSALEISGDALDDRVRYRLLKEAVVMYAANRRRGTHDTKTRAEVAGSTHKMWRQKGTGRARAGSRKNPLWRGGGTIFGPHPRDYSYAINKKQRRLALRSALYSRFQDGGVLVLEGLEVDTPRTKTVAQVLQALGLRGRCLIGTAAPDRNLALSARNLPGVTVLPVGDFNAEVVLLAERIVLTPEAFEKLREGRTLPSSGEGSAGEPASRDEDTAAGEASSEPSATEASEEARD